MQSEPVGDVYRLYLEQGRQAQDVRILQDALHHLTERVASLTARVVNLEPVTSTSALTVMGDGKVVDISALGDTYTGSSLLRRVFSADGHPLYNTTEPSQPTGFARGKFPENADPTTLLYVCGDDYNEVGSCKPLANLCTRCARGRSSSWRAAARSTRSACSAICCTPQRCAGPSTTTASRCT